MDLGRYEEAVAVNERAVDHFREAGSTESMDLALSHRRKALRALGRD